MYMVMINRKKTIVPFTETGWNVLRKIKRVFKHIGDKLVSCFVRYRLITSSWILDQDLVYSIVLGHDLHRTGLPDSGSIAIKPMRWLRKCRLSNVDFLSAVIILFFEYLCNDFNLRILIVTVFFCDKIKPTNLV